MPSGKGSALFISSAPLENVPRLWVDLFEFDLVRCNYLPFSIEYEESSASGSLID